MTTQLPAYAEWTATIIFALALVHSFLVKVFQSWARRFPEGSIAENFLHLLGEVELVFGIWAAVYLVFLGISQGQETAIAYLESRSFTEPVFVSVIMSVCATRPVLSAAGALIQTFSKLLPLKKELAFYFATLTLGPLLGSLITEPAAMTVTALILMDRYYSRGISERLKYATLGLLFVNVSIGGTLTPFAAPPVLMVASKWGWSLGHMFQNFGWKGALACIFSTALVAWRFRGELSSLASKSVAGGVKIPAWLTLTHLVALVAIVACAHQMVIFIGVFLFFLGIVRATHEYQSPLELRGGLLVGFFLAGLVVLGGPQRWWLEPLLSNLSSGVLYLGAIGLTAVTDNAALTYLGSQVPTLSEFSKYALVAGSVVGGGLTVIANAPNPAGFGILNPAFGSDGISPMRLFLSALVPTLIAAGCFWFL